MIGVHAATWRGGEYAVKKLPIVGMEVPQDFVTEMEVNESVQHPNIVQFYPRLLSLPKEAFLFSTRPELASVVAARVEAIARAP